MPLVIAKTVLPDAQKFYLALGRIFGIGRAHGLAIAEEVGISKEARVADVKANHVRQVCGDLTATRVWICRHPWCPGSSPHIH
jgi:ribosomal protein S13